MSRIAGIPHASVCGGRGRCSTCRVRIGGPDRAQLPPPSPDEQKVLARVGAPDNVRLACQLRPPPGRYRVTPLLPAVGGPGRGLSPAAAGAWRRALCRHPVRRHPRLHLDLRGPAALRRGVPAQPLFPRHRPGGAGGRRPARQVHRRRRDGDLRPRPRRPRSPAARRSTRRGRMALALDDLNEALSGDLDQPLRIGIGLHAGPAIVGEMGYDRAASLTAIGDTVNTASRLETLTKDFKVELVVSQELLDRAGIDLVGRAAARGRYPRPPGQAGGARRPAGPRPHELVIVISLRGPVWQKECRKGGDRPCAPLHAPGRDWSLAALSGAAFAAWATIPARPVGQAGRSDLRQRQGDDRGEGLQRGAAAAAAGRRQGAEERRRLQPAGLRHAQVGRSQRLAAVLHHGAADRSQASRRATNISARPT